MINLSKALRRDRGKCSIQTGLGTKFDFYYCLFLIVITVEKGRTGPNCDLVSAYA